MKITKKQVLDNLEEVKKYIKEEEVEKKFKIKNRYTGEVIYSSSKTNIKEALEEAIRIGANLFEANLSGVDFSGVDFSGTNLFGADLSGANFSEANLFEANLSETNLSGINLSGTNLSGANLSGANINKSQINDFLRALRVNVE